MSDELELIPRAVRDKLDRVAIKLHLRQWQLLSLDERRELLDLSCQTAAEITAYRERLGTLIRSRCGCEPSLVTKAS